MLNAMSFNLRYCPTHYDQASRHKSLTDFAIWGWCPCTFFSFCPMLYFFPHKSGRVIPWSFIFNLTFSCCLHSPSSSSSATFLRFYIREATISFPLLSSWKFQVSPAIEFLYFNHFYCVWDMFSFFGLLTIWYEDCFWIGHYLVRKLFFFSEWNQILPQ